jgi:phosphatidylglycerol:prolipoprotein diacylglycerol transferase
VIVIGFDPPLLQLGSSAVRPWGLLSVVGLVLAVWLAARRSSEGDREALLRAAVWAIPLGVVCARVVHVLGWWEFYLTRPATVWQFGIDGLSLWGGLVGGGLAAAAALRHDRLQRRRVFDLAVRYVALAIALGRFGAFVEGAGQGQPSGLLWATQYTSVLAATPDFGVPRHPAQVYDGLVALGLCIGLIVLQRRGLRHGLAALVFVAVYGFARVLLGAVRVEPAFLFGLQIEQLLAVGAVVASLIVAMRQARRGAVSTVSKRSPQLAA